MLLYPTVPSMLVNTSNSRYLLVNAIARRAREIAQDAEDHGEILDEKPVTLACRDIAAGRVTAHINDK